MLRRPLKYIYSSCIQFCDVLINIYPWKNFPSLKNGENLHEPSGSSWRAVWAILCARICVDDHFLSISCYLDLNVTIWALKCNGYLESLQGPSGMQLTSHFSVARCPPMIIFSFRQCELSISRLFDQFSPTKFSLHVRNSVFLHEASGNSWQAIPAKPEELFY